MKAQTSLHPALRGVRAVLFDMGGTLVHPDWERLARLASTETGREFAAADLGRKFKEMMCAVDAGLQRGDPPPEDSTKRNWVFRRVYRALDMDDAACEKLSGQLDATHAERHLWSAPDPEAPAVLGALRAAGLRIAVISNTEDGRLEELLDLVELKTHFDFFIDSYIVGARKPDAAIFQLALSRLELEPEDAVYIGDSYGHDALAALAVGMRAVLLDPLGFYPESVCPRIRTLGELIE
ncbi:MAG TPA: HAD-IA family hydrolase [Pyrinomonadaceae bacterium]|nr:HAD-IA family hydrolase [Pyrinomonadaceae bacterium]